MHTNRRFLCYMHASRRVWLSVQQPKETWLCMFSQAGGNLRCMSAIIWELEASCPAAEMNFVHVHIRRKAIAVLSV